MIFVIFHTAGNKEKKIFIMNNEKIFFFDAVGWKSYCNTKKCCIVELGMRGARGRGAQVAWAGSSVHSVHPT